MRISISLLAILVSACATAPPPSPVFSLDAELEAARAETGTPGLAAVVARSKEGIIASGVAGVRRLGSNDPIRRGDKFHIGSITKPFTATLAGMLVAEGRLTWETKIVDVLPEWRDTIRAEYREVTVADLLSHEAGIPVFGEDEEFAGLRFEGTPPEQRRKFVAHALAMPPVSARGTYQYSNAGYAAAAVMIEKITGQSWEQLIRTRIAKPLGLESLGFGWPATSDRDQPWGHIAEEGGAIKPHDPNGEYQLTALIAPAGNLHMNMEDLATFLAEHLRALRGHPAFLPPGVARTMHTRRTRSGLGFGVGKVAGIEPVHTHSGSAETFTTYIAIAPAHDTVVAISANAADEAAETAMKKVLRELIVRYATLK
jgi:D-alanyl-D-alanine carboxypeptidase